MKANESNGRLENWEPEMHRPQLPEGWECMEQRGQTRFSETNFAKYISIHHLKPKERLWIIFNEFNMDHYANQTLQFKYSVRGGDNTKPNSKLRYFDNVTDALNYVYYVAESTDKWEEEINSESYIRDYDKRIEDLKSKLANRYAIAE